MFYITDSSCDLVIRVDGLPPAKGGPSVLSSAHRHHDRALKLLRAAAEALPPDWAPLREAVGLTLIVSAPTEAPPGDPTNFLGGVADVLQRKVPNDVLGELAFIVVYENDLQLRSVEYRQRLSTEVSYELCIRGLGGPDQVTPRVAAVPAIGVSVEFLEADELAPRSSTCSCIPGGVNLESRPRRS